MKSLFENASTNFSISGWDIKCPLLIRKSNFSSAYFIFKHIDQTSRRLSRLQQISPLTISFDQTSTQTNNFIDLRISTTHQPTYRLSTRHLALLQTDFFALRQLRQLSTDLSTLTRHRAILQTVFFALQRLRYCNTTTRHLAIHQPDFCAFRRLQQLTNRRIDINTTFRHSSDGLLRLSTTTHNTTLFDNIKDSHSKHGVQD